MQNLSSQSLSKGMPLLIVCFSDTKHLAAIIQFIIMTAEATGCVRQQLSDVNRIDSCNFELCLQGRLGITNN